MSRILSWPSLALFSCLAWASVLQGQEKDADGKPGEKFAESPAGEPAPAKVKFVAPANLKLDAAKTRRLGSLLDNSHVLKELDFSDEVIARLQQVKQQEQAALAALSEEFRKERRAMRGLPPAERAERMRNLSPARRTALQETFTLQRFGLLTASQLQRLAQIDCQDQGFDVFLSGDAIEAFKLNDEERRKLDEIYNTYMARIGPALPTKPYRESAAVRSTSSKVVAMVKERTVKTDKLLGKERVEKLAELRGKPFDLSRLDEPIRDATTTERLVDLIQYEAVRKDLGLTAEEVAAIVAARAKTEWTGQELERDVTSGQEAAARVREKMLLLRRDYQTELAKILKEPHFTRLEQIDLQRNWRRLRPLRILPGMPNELELTSEQLTKFQGIERESRGGYGPRGNTKDVETKLLELLTPEQREKLKELQGPPFDVSIFDPLGATNRQDPLEAKFDQGVIDYVNGTLLREQDTNGDLSLDKSEWVKENGPQPTRQKTPT